MHQKPENENGSKGVIIKSVFILCQHNIYYYFLLPIIFSLRIKIKREKRVDHYGSLRFTIILRHFAGFSYSSSGRLRSTHNDT